MKTFAIFFIRFYQNSLSPDHGPLRGLFPGKHPIVCRFDPTCSEYALEAIETYGVRKGFLLGVRRVSRCHPYTHTSPYDPVT